MPKIRKKTSNRLKTHDREKVKKRVKDSKKKKGKLAKKNPQWKSKKPKDPGIPNDFPYKDQILAEVQEQRRMVAGEKLRKQEEKRKAVARAKAIALGDEIEGSSEGEPEDEHVTMSDDQGDVSKPSQSLDVGAESIANLSAKTLNATLKPRPRSFVDVPEHIDDDDDKVPVLINRDLPNIGAVLDKADVVLNVLDARDPLAFRSKHIEELATAKGKKIIFVLNKIDRCPREAVAAWGAHLRTQHPTFLFRAASAFLPEDQASTTVPQNKGGSKGKSRIPVNNAVGEDALCACLAQVAKELPAGKNLNVAVVGFTNVGKSSVINSLLKKSALAVYSLSSTTISATTTELPQEVTLELPDIAIFLIDTPGLSFVSNSEDAETLNQTRIQDILLRSRGRIDRLKDPIPPISQIVSNANNEDLMLLYSLPAFTKGDTTAFLSGVARAHQLVKKKGELDLTGAARIVLRDWNIGKFLHYATAAGPPADANAEDADALATLPTRRDMRKAGGLIKMSIGRVDERCVDLEKDWVVDDESEDGDLEELDEEMREEDGNSSPESHSGSDQESDEDDEADDLAEAPAVLLQQKRKPEAEVTSSRPPKKVSLGRVSAFTAKDKRTKLASKNAPLAQPNKAVNGPKSILKKTSGLSSKTGSIRTANVKTNATKASALKASDRSTGPEAYDFGKFF